MPKPTKSTATRATEPRVPSLLISGGRVVDPAARLDANMDILLRDGRVAEIASPKKIRGAADEKLDVRGLIVAPGFIDLHVHLREPGQAYKETIASGTAAAAAGGFTAVCAMPNTSPVNDSPEITSWMQKPERGACVNLFPVAAATQGSQGERLTDFRALRSAGAVAFTDDGKPLLDEALLQQALWLSAELQAPLIQHAEDTRRTAGCSMHDGPTAFRLGLRGMPIEAEAKVVEHDIQMAQATGARYHVAHLSTAEALKSVRRGKRSRAQITCEVTPHHFTLIDEDVGEYNTNCKMNPPLRSAADREALLVALADGTVDAIATDHAPHATHEKQVEFERAAFGVIGLETAVGLALTRLHRERSVPLTRIAELFSTGPARVLGLKSRGSLHRGYHADITIFDPKKRWTYDVSNSKSLARNSPFDGWQLTGKVVATIVSGRIVYRSA
jgi:dihydroorotase